MKWGTNRILTTHVGSLVHPSALMNLIQAKDSGQAYDPAQLVTTTRNTVREVVRRQVEVGIEIPHGEYGKPRFSAYVNERLSAFTRRPRAGVAQGP